MDFLVQIKESNQHTLVFSRQRIDQIIFAYPIGFANLTFDQIPFYGTPEFFFGFGGADQLLEDRLPASGGGGSGSAGRGSDPLVEAPLL